MKYTFLHISDLHYRPDWPEEVELVRKRFIEDVAVQLPKYENTYLVFSGDLVERGGDSALYTALETDLGNALTKVAIPKERRICVPGNHDISQDLLRTLLTIQQGTIDRLSEERSFNDAVPQLSQLIFASKFQHYRDFESRFASYTCCGTAQLGGTGWELPGGIGIYCLNTALCSCAGLNDHHGNQISDRGGLMVDTRALHRWLSETAQTVTTRILVMHHPLDWLSEWARTELEKVIAREFQLVFSGHTHENSATFSSRGVGGVVHCAAPPLFTRKSELLGYAFVTLNSMDGSVSVDYRQWATTHEFVRGTSFSGNDYGTIAFSLEEKRTYMPSEIRSPASHAQDTMAILQAEFEEATTCYSSKRPLWVDRDLASTPENVPDRESATLITLQQLVANLRSCVIRAPKQFGLTCVGHFVALEYSRHQPANGVLAVLDMHDMPHHKQTIRHLENRCIALKTSTASLAGIILDNWSSDKRARLILGELTKAFPRLPIIILYGVDESRQIGNALELGDEASFESLFLWGLTRQRIRELVVAYVEGMDSLDDDLVTKKVTEDLDALNIYRTPLNCLMILKLAEQAFEDSPVNRTEMIGRVLYLLFYQFNKIPRYATRPDLKDCEYALGYFCEWLVRAGKTVFEKSAFYAKVQEYCKSQIIDLDIEVLFAFLASENIIVRRGEDFAFRFSYWLYFFAAHRMHHNEEFANFILHDRRYSAFPEIVEFYAGIDRRRSDAVTRLTADLKEMNRDFLNRTRIAKDFDPFGRFVWSPDEKALRQLEELVNTSMAESAFPMSVKDSLADSHYDRSKPYNQELARFLEESTLTQLVQAMKGAARALRNSDHVMPSIKAELLEEVLSCWTRVCQILVVLSPVLAKQQAATFEDMRFFLKKGEFDQDSTRHRWEEIMTVILENVVFWYQEDLFSKKMGALLSKYIRSHEGEIGEILVLLLMVRQKPPGWEREIERFVVRENKNSFYLNRLFTALYHESRYGFSTERARQDLKRLAAMSIAKHDVGAKRPNSALIKRAEKALDIASAEADQKTKQKPTADGESV